MVAKPTPEGARYDFNWLSATGSGCFLAAVYLYDISVATGQFEIMKESIAGITPDRRLQVLLSLIHI